MTTRYVHATTTASPTKQNNLDPHFPSFNGAPRASCWSPRLPPPNNAVLACGFRRNIPPRTKGAPRHVAQKNEEQLLLHKPLTAQSPAMLPRHQAHCSRRSGLWCRRFRTRAGTAPCSTTVLVLQVDAMFVSAHAASNCAHVRTCVHQDSGLGGRKRDEGVSKSDGWWSHDNADCAALVVLRYTSNCLLTSDSEQPACRGNA